MSTSKIAPIRVVLGFSAMTDNDLVAFVNGVLKGLTGNPSLRNPTVPLTTFGKDITGYSTAVTAALDGGKSAKVTCKEAKKVVVNDLRKLAMYVESNCNDDLAIFTTSGFTARQKRSAAGPVDVSTFKWLDYGLHPEQILVSIKSAHRAKSYNVRFGAIPPTPATPPPAAGWTPSSMPASTGATAGATPGATPSWWTVLNVANIKKAIPIDNLISGTLYAVQMQALGMQGLSPWSDSSTIMCP